MRQWHIEGHPFVICRQRVPGNQLSLGFCLPAPGTRPRRIAALAKRDAVVRAARPPELSRIQRFLTQGRRDREEKRFSGLSEVSPTFAHLSQTAAAAELNIRVFGSWMWEALTGVSYAGASSDLDVLVDVANKTEADRAAAFLAHAEKSFPCKLDGELSVTGLGEIHWREYLRGEPVILVKSIDAVRMLSREDLWA